MVMELNASTFRVLMNVDVLQITMETLTTGSARHLKYGASMTTNAVKTKNASNQGNVCVLLRTTQTRKTTTNAKVLANGSLAESTRNAPPAIHLDAYAKPVSKEILCGDVVISTNVPVIHAPTGLIV